MASAINGQFSSALEQVVIAINGFLLCVSLYNFEKPIIGFIPLFFLLNNSKIFFANFYFILFIVFIICFSILHISLSGYSFSYVNLQLSNIVGLIFGSFIA